MARVKTFTNGGSLLPGDLNSIEDDYEFAFSTYKSYAHRSILLSAAGAGLKYMSPAAESAGITTLNQLGGTAGLITLDPADLTAGTRGNKWRVAARLFTNGTASAVNFVVGLYSVSASAGGAAAWAPTVSGVIAGSSATINAPAINSILAANSGDFTPPAAGGLLLGVSVSGAMAASSLVTIVAELQSRQV